MPYLIGNMKKFGWLLVSVALLLIAAYSITSIIHYVNYLLDIEKGEVFVYFVFIVLCVLWYVAFFKGDRFKSDLLIHLSLRRKKYRTDGEWLKEDRSHINTYLDSIQKLHDAQESHKNTALGRPLMIDDKSGKKQGG